MSEYSCITFGNLPTIMSIQACTESAKYRKVTFLRVSQSLERFYPVGGAAELGGVLAVSVSKTAKGPFAKRQIGRPRGLPPVGWRALRYGIHRAYASQAICV